MYRSILDTFTAHAADTDPEWLFLVEERRLLASELLVRSATAAAVLARQGVAAGSFVGLSMGNQSGFVIATLAAWRLGAALVPLRPLSGSSPELSAFLARIHERSPLAALVIDGGGDATAIARWSAHSGCPVLPVAALDSPCPEAAVEPPPVTPPEAIALVQYSSGSTGQPKGVLVTHGMVVEQVDQIATSFLSGTGRALRSLGTWMPLHHDGGLFIGVMLPLLLGCRNLLATARYFVARPQRWFQFVAQRQVDMLVCTNAAMVLALPQLVKLAPGSLDLRDRHLFLSAEKVSPLVLRRTRAWLASCGASPSQLHVPFGMAENTLCAACAYGAPPASGWFSINERGMVTPEAAPVPGAIELVSCGPPFPGVSLQIRDDQDRPLPPLCLGELTITGPCVMPGYINDPEATRLTLRGGRLHTNDLAFLHQGELWYVARKDDMLIVDGRNIVPDDIEHTAEELEFVRPGSTALVALERHGSQQLHLLVEDSPAAIPGETIARRRRIQETVLGAHHLFLQRVSFCARGTIEKTSSGKKRRKVIRQRLCDGLIELYGNDAPLLQVALGQGCSTPCR